MNDSTAPLLQNDEIDRDVGRRNGRFFWPFDEKNIVAVEFIAESRLLPFILVLQAIQIKVAQVQPADMVGFEQGIGRTLYMACVAQCIQNSAHQASLPCTQIAIEMNDHAGFESCCQTFCQRQGCIFISEGKGDSAIIVVMQNVIPQSGRYEKLAENIRDWAHELGFQAAGIANTDLAEAETGLLNWLGQGFHGQMDYMAKHGTKRSRPADLLAGTLCVISVRMDYLPSGARDSWEVLGHGESAFVSRYALGRDYHKLLRRRLAQLAERIRLAVADFEGRVFVDSAPVMEVELAIKSGLGWRGKHTLLLSQDAGSFFFLGEIYTNLPLPVDQPKSAHCGSCTRCIEVCPTQAIIAPYRLDARRCISYLTIELKGSIPIALRPLIGNRIYGCDDCQLVCPWNRFARMTSEPDFSVRNGLDDASLVELFAWDENAFREKLAGSAIYRIGHEQWLRNIAVAMGNAPRSAALVAALQARIGHASEHVREHVSWALSRQAARLCTTAHTARAEKTASKTLR